MRWMQYLEVSLDVRQKGNVAETGNDEHQERDGENEHLITDLILIYFSSQVHRGDYLSR